MSFSKKMTKFEFDEPAKEESTVFDAGNNDIDQSVSENWNECSWQVKSLQKDSFVKEEVMFKYKQIYISFLIYMTSVIQKQDWIEDPDILSFKLCKNKYDNFNTKLCSIVDTNTLMNQHRGDSTYFDNIYDDIVSLFSNIYSKLFFTGDTGIGYYDPTYDDDETKRIAKLLITYFSRCFFLRTFMNKRILPYNRYLLKTKPHTESVSTIKALKRIINSVNSSYDELCKFDLHEAASTIIEERNAENKFDYLRFPFRHLRLHYTNDYYYKKIFGTTLKIPNIIPVVMKNPEIQRFREQVNFKLMIYGHPMASNGMYQEVMSSLEDMGVFRSS